jgi:hypothetical protein
MYNADADDDPDSYKHCQSQSHFNDVWKKNFSNVRLRKYCRFAKCDFCVHWRMKSEDLKIKPEAIERFISIVNFLLPK